MTNSLVIAFVYESQSAFLARGYTAEAVSEMTHDAEIDGIAHTLTALGHRVAHVPGIEALVTHLADPTDHAAWRTWDLVFNMSEGVRGAAREAQVPALLEAYGVLYTFADAATMAVCLDKARTKVESV